jgi:hypothetical protein
MRGGVVPGWWGRRAALGVCGGGWRCGWGYESSAAELVDRVVLVLRVDETRTLQGEPTRLNFQRLVAITRPSRVRGLRSSGRERPFYCVPLNPEMCILPVAANREERAGRSGSAEE